MKKISVKKAARRVVIVCLLVLVAVGVFCAGYFTYYFSLDDSIRTLIWMKDKIDAKYYEDISEEDFLSAALDGINGLLDSYSTCYTPDEYLSAASSMAGNKEGLGLTFLTGDGLLVYRVSGNSPAEESGIQEGTYLVGYALEGESVQEATSYNDFAAFLADIPADTAFTVVFAETAQGDNSVTYTVCKSEYTENYAFYRSSDSAYRFTGEDALTETAYDGAIPSLDGDTAYIRLNQFAGNAAEQVGMCLDIFKREGKNNLILDLRNNGGGSMGVLEDIAAYFLKDATSKSAVVAVAKYKSGSEEKFRASGNDYGDYFSAGSTITVLANYNTASASECLLGAMLDYGTIDYGDIYLSEIDGVARTYGKGIMQTTYYDYDGGYAIKLTTAQIYWPLSGTCIHGRGILPEDGANTVTAAAVVTYGDAELLTVVSRLAAG